MREAVVEAKVAVRELGEGVVRTEAELVAERQRLADAERRGRLAAEIQDRETVDVAARFAAKHRERVGVLERKLAAQRDELGLTQRELTEMQAQLARAERDRPLTEAERSAERAWRDLEAAGGVRPGTDLQAELLTAFHECSPVLRGALQNEHHFDVEKWEQRLGEILRAPSAPEPVDQNELFG